MISSLWEKNDHIEISYASKFLTSADNERKNALVISIKVDLDNISDDNVTDFLPAWSSGKII